MPDGKEIPYNSEEGEALRQKQYEQKKKAFEEWKGKALEKIDNLPSDPDKGLEVLTESVRSRIDAADSAINMSLSHIRSLERNVENLEPIVNSKSFPEKHHKRMEAELISSKEEIAEERENVLISTQRKQEAMRELEMLKNGVETIKQGIKPDARFMDALAAEEAKRAEYISDPKMNPHAVTFEEERATGLKTEQLRFLKSRTNLKRMADLRKMAEDGQDVDAGWE